MIGFIKLVFLGLLACSILLSCLSIEPRVGEVAAGEVVAGEVAAVEVAAGEVAAGEVAAGEVAAGEVAAGEMVSDEVPCASSSQGCPDLEFRHIEGGSFDMGDDNSSSENEKPAHNVNINSFEIMIAEVTVGQYRRCVEDEFCDVPRFQGDENYTWSSSIGQRENYPINGISWFQLMTFAAWVGARLPTESEWEYAARSQGQEHNYPWGNAEPTCELVNFNGSSFVNGPSQKCGHSSGNTNQGICDMAGNMWEWVQDEWHSNYNGAPTDGTGWCMENCPRNANDIISGQSYPTQRVLRGGHWNHGRSNIRTRHRYGASPTENNKFHGGRLVRLP